MKIRMLKSAPGSVDGIRVDMYEVDHEYDLSVPPGAVDLAQAFVSSGAAEEVRASAAKVVPQDAGALGALAQAETKAVEPPAATARPERKPKSP